MRLRELITDTARTVLSTGLQVGIATGVALMMLMQMRVAIRDDRRRHTARPKSENPPAWGKEPMA